MTRPPKTGLSQSRNGLFPLVALPGYRPRGQISIKLNSCDAAIGTLTSPAESPLVGAALFPRPVACDSGVTPIVQKRQPTVVPRPALRAHLTLGSQRSYTGPRSLIPRYWTFVIPVDGNSPTGTGGDCE